MLFGGVTLKEGVIWWSDFIREGVIWWSDLIREGVIWWSDLIRECYLVEWPYKRGRYLVE